MGAALATGTSHLKTVSPQSLFLFPLRGSPSPSHRFAAGPSLSPRGRRGFARIAHPRTAYLISNATFVDGSEFST